MNSKTTASFLFCFIFNTVVYFRKGSKATDTRTGNFFLSTDEEIQTEILFDVKSFSTIACGCTCFKNDECKTYVFDSDASRCLGFSGRYHCQVTFLQSTAKLYQRHTEMFYETTWSVIVKTSDIVNAGTNAVIKIALYGQSENTDDIRLDNVENNFEQAQIDTFTIKLKDVGKPLRLKLWMGAGSDWHLDKYTEGYGVIDTLRGHGDVSRKLLYQFTVRKRKHYRVHDLMNNIEIENMECNEKFVFSCGCWIQGNDEIVQDLVPV